MRMGGRPATSRHTGAGEPVEVYDAGSSVAAGLLLRAVRHEALLDRMGVGDLRRLGRRSGGVKLEAAGSVDRQGWGGQPPPKRGRPRPPGGAGFVERAAR